MSHCTSSLVVGGVGGVCLHPKICDMAARMILVTSSLLLTVILGSDWEVCGRCSGSVRFVQQTRHPVFPIPEYMCLACLDRVHKLLAGTILGEPQ